ncbi:hypothetical protein PoB_002308300 [Plakobranchus ocellatus]|uniref:Uncharacterized protein n=1 Tax=Plakobranchus ocellatus TaxID=259542 RepID=A0AAV3ZQ30_9GAST|nr:hypothetical protein PoB_002308300 [Plakobranchus ocellatus]
MKLPSSWHSDKITRGHRPVNIFFLKKKKYPPSMATGLCRMFYLWRGIHADTMLIHCFGIFYSNLARQYILLHCPLYHTTTGITWSFPMPRIKICPHNLYSISFREVEKGQFALILGSAAITENS